jgi:hypothetical protein
MLGISSIGPFRTSTAERQRVLPLTRLKEHGDAAIFERDEVRGKPVAEESLRATREYTGTVIAMMRVEFQSNRVAIEGSRKTLAESYLLLRKLRNVERLTSKK